MDFRRKRKSFGGIPTSSMSDVAFLLLIFFLTTTKFDIKNGLGLVLPPASSGSAKKVKLKTENITKVWINSEGKVKLIIMDKEENIPMSQLESRVKGIVMKNSDMVFSLKTDRRCPYKFMVRALDKLQAAGAEKISLSTN
ncbi:MAG: biopolymer transporter ExbD [Bacteroidetes bacterium]|nr:MAG: biopolymer transporter ExbD [Bacteroidota bacterium]